ncbi:GNAT family N-acetyltransferase [Streptomyces sp. NPDC059166]|uniref:GNAT family N-acetyltransferase n=1 Tax=Streptomyces sp. NPDC059166 TaxID=3346752 RepID=UPI00367D7848
MDTAIQDYALALTRRSPGHYRVGPFTVRHNPQWELKFANYAIPDEGAEPSARDVADLVGSFRERDRLPRLEYLPSWAPAVEPALLAAGFTEESRAPVMVCTPGTLLAPKPVDGLRISEPAGADEFASAAAVQHTGFGGEGGPDDGEIAWLRAAAASGGVAALATVDDLPAGAGGCSAPVGGIGELAGLAVAESYRNRGVGAALSAWLTRTAFDRGFRSVWLEPGGPDVERVYARIGYRRAGEKLNISLVPR